jgi:hypothetical protein
MGGRVAVPEGRGGTKDTADAGDEGAGRGARGAFGGSWVHFAGEHTSTYGQGYLNGGVETGLRAAREILNAVGRSARTIA